MRSLFLALAVLGLAAPAGSAAPARQPAPVCQACMEATVRHLAAPELNGRRCGTEDEARAAGWLEGEFRRIGVPGAWPGGAYLQTTPFDTPRFAAPPRLTVGDRPALTHGGEMIVLRDPRPASGRLVRLTSADQPGDLTGAVVFLDAAMTPTARTALLQRGAVALITEAEAPQLAAWADLLDVWPPSPMAGPAPAGRPVRLILRPEGAAVLRRAAEGTPVRLEAALGEPEHRATRNVVAVLRGSGPAADDRPLLLSAHYDHLGMRGGQLHPGADDDASGTAAVLELARLLKAGPRPKRTVYFALFGCEESGGLGAAGFREAPPVPLARFMANVELEMIAFRDPKMPDKLMMTGWERSDLGALLAAAGARVGPDPYPEGDFFRRSDNYPLALKGVVAHTISAWPTPPTYHQPTDTAPSLDYAFMAEAVRSLAEPLRRLADGAATPAWRPGGRP